MKSAKWSAEIVDFLFEVGILNEVPRSGLHFLGGSRQSVAEHSFRTTVIAYCLAKMVPEADEAKLIKMCLLHDVSEARTGDLNYVHKKYVQADEEKALREQSAPLPFCEEYRALMTELKAAQSLESRLARDADQLEFLLVLKRTLDIGNPDARSWIPFALQRLKTDAGKALGERISKAKSDAWWFDDDKEWWIHAGHGQTQKDERALE